MPKISVDHTCQLSTEEAFKKIKSFFENDQDIRRIDSKLQCDFSESQMSGKVKGSQFKADVLVEKLPNGSLVKVIVDLPLMLSPFKGKVQETIQKKLAKYLA